MCSNEIFCPAIGWILVVVLVVVVGMLTLHNTGKVAVVFTDSISSADGVHAAQRPLEQRGNVRGAGRTSSHGDRSARGRGNVRDTPSNDRVKPSAQHPTPSPVSNDVTVQSASAVKSTATNTGKEAGDSVKLAAEKPKTHNQSESGSEPSVNNTEKSGTEVTPGTGAVVPAGD